jgi:hypothetical protein
VTARSDVAERDARVAAVLRGGRMSQAEVAREFGLSRRQVERIATAAADRPVAPVSSRERIEVAIARHWPDIRAVCVAAGASPLEVQAVLAALDGVNARVDRSIAGRPRRRARAFPRPRPCLEP